MKPIWCSHWVIGWDATGGSVFAVKSILQVNFRLADQVISADQVPVVHGHHQHWLHGESGLNVKWSEWMWWKWVNQRVILTIIFSDTRFDFNVLSKYRIELFGDVVFLVFHLGLSQLDDNIWISLPIDISGVKVCGLKTEIKKRKNENIEGTIRFPLKWLDFKYSCVVVVFSWDGVLPHPDHINTDQNIDWIIMWNVLEHAHIWVKPGLSGDLLRQWQFVHT